MWLCGLTRLAAKIGLLLANLGFGLPMAMNHLLRRRDTALSGAYSSVQNALYSILGNLL